MLKTLFMVVLTVFSYNVKCGKTVTPLSYDDRQEGDKIIMVQQFGEQTSWFTMDKDLRTTEFRILSKKDGTDASIKLENGVYTLKGKVKGKDVTKEGINAAMKAAASESFGYNEDPIVSSDVIGMRFGSLFDATQTMVSKIADDLYQVQVVSWYDNENSYTSQMVRTIKYFSELK